MTTSTIQAKAMPTGAMPAETVPARTVRADAVQGGTARADLARIGTTPTAANDMLRAGATAVTDASRIGGGIRAALAALDRRHASALLRDETGAATAEYAIATLAAVGFAGLLVVILRSEQVRGLLAGIIETALTVAG